MEPISIEKTKKITNHYGLTPVELRVHCRFKLQKIKPGKYEVISWDEFGTILDKKNYVCESERKLLSQNHEKERSIV